ncbi:MAG: type I-C CRISPR-associated endonuclease Cas1c [Lachnospiraceae bacterium]|nr:type I-C CRISPR-associated endonuclease Cas1c [Lachnospiraceae bacterium]
MKKLLNTLYITSTDYYLSLDGENIVIISGKSEAGRIPLHNLEAVVTCGFQGVSPALMGACSERNIDISFLSLSGKFLARVSGRQKGNVLLRRQQYRLADNPDKAVLISKNFLTGKLFNSRWVIERGIRDHTERLDVECLKKVSENIKNSLGSIRKCDNKEGLRGIEGESASKYFSIFNELILQQKDDFIFRVRSKRPPLDPVNAMLSFAYTLLASMCTSALEIVGLDPYVGFMHTDRPGRCSLALDLMEELRSVFADRFVLSLINKKMISLKDFLIKENGTVLMKDDARKRFVSEWQKRKTERITHPFLNEKIEWGMVPYSQALLLARTIRGDLDEYPPLLWK